MAMEKILVVDDSPLVRKLAEVSLQEAGYEVYTAENGEEGLKIAESIVPDLILVDFIMPVMTGSQFCTLLKENEKLKDIPILLITGKGETVGQTFVEKFGVVDYFIKPFKSEDLVEKVEEIFRRHSKLKIAEVHPVTEELEEISVEEKIKEEILYEDSTLTPENVVSKEEILFEVPTEVSTEVSEELATGEEEIKMPDFSLFEEKIEEEKVSEEVISQEIPEDKEQIEVPQEILEKISEEVEILPSEEEEFKEELKPFDLTELDEDTQLKSEREEREFYETIEVIPEKKEEMEEIEKIQMEPEQKFQAVPIDVQEIERLIETKLKNFSEELIPSINLSFENILKKYGFIKNFNILLSGKLEGLGLGNLFEFLENIKTNGLLTIFTKDSVFELLLIDGQMVYCLSDRSRISLGDKLLKEFDPAELQQITEANMSVLKNSEIDSFILEKKDLFDAFLQNLPKYKLKEML